MLLVGMRNHCLILWSYKTQKNIVKIIYVHCLCVCSFVQLWYKTSFCAKAIDTQPYTKPYTAGKCNSIPKTAIAMTQDVHIHVYMYLTAIAWQGLHGYGTFA